MDNWDDRRPAFIRRWIDQHATDGAALGKPVLLQEFGSFASQRESIYTAILGAVAAVVEGGSALKGAGMWQLFMPGQVGPLSEGGGGGALVWGADGSSTFVSVCVHIQYIYTHMTS